jgi:hypothetical protein
MLSTIKEAEAHITVLHVGFFFLLADLEAFTKVIQQRINFSVFLRLS